MAIYPSVVPSSIGGLLLHTAAKGIASDPGKFLSNVATTVYNAGTANRSGNLIKGALVNAAGAAKTIASALGKGAVTSEGAYQDAVKTSVQKAFPDGILSGVVGTTVPSSSAASASSGVTYYPSDGGTVAAVPDYLNADLAKAYNMDSTTAYQEALSNTSYQRAVADLQAAGLNPVLAATGLQPAGGVYSARPQASMIGGQISTGVSSGQGEHNYYKVFSNLGALLGAGIGLYAGGIKGGYFGGRIGSSIGGSLGNLFDL